MPRLAKSIAWMFCISEHILMHLPQRMHLEGSRTIAGEESSMGSLQ